MVPGVGGRNNNSGHRGIDGGATEGIIYDCWGGAQCRSGYDRQTGTRRGDSDGGGNSGARGTSGTLPPAPTKMEQRLDNVEDGETGEEDVAPEGLYSGVRSPYLSEHGRPGPEAQLQPLYGNGVSACHLPKGTLTLTQAHDTPPTLTAWTSDKDAGRHNLL